MTGELPHPPHGETTSRRRGSAKRRRRVRFGAGAVVAALIATLVPASLATAQDPDPLIAADVPPGYVSGLPGPKWSASAPFLLAEMPGNLPGQVAVSAIGDRQIQAAGADAPFYGYNLSVEAPKVPETPTAQTPAEFANCLGTHREAGYTAYCATSSFVLFFQRPVVNPTFAFSAYSGWPGENDDGSRGCYATLSTGGIGAVNGAAPATGQVTLAKEVTRAPGEWSHSLVNNRVVPQGSYPAPTDRCNTTFVSNGVFLTVHGVVSSVQLDFPTYRTIYKQLAADYWSTHAQGTFTTQRMGFGVPSSDLSVEKTGTSSIDPGGSIDWELTVSNAEGSSPSHGYIIEDAIPASVSNPQLIEGPPGCSLSGRDLLCGVAPSGFTIAKSSSVSTIADLSGADLTSVGTVLDAGASTTVKLRATAPLSASEPITNTATVRGVDLDPNVADNSSTARTDITPPTWTLAKTATVNGSQPAGGLVSPGDVISYTIKATSVTGAVGHVVITDDLSEVLDGATFNPGSAVLQVGPGSPIAVADPSGTPPTLATPTFNLPAGTTATLTYQVTVAQDAWSSTFTNRAHATADYPLTTCDPCSTTNRTGALLQIAKVGHDDTGAQIGLTGADFEILADDNGAPGDVVTSARVTAVDEGTPGRYEVRNLPSGMYWIKETAAPSGYQLLAEPVAFTVRASGAVAVIDEAANPNVTVSDENVLTVADQRTLTLPQAGGSGSSGYVWSGALVAGAAVLAAWLLRTRRQTRN